MNGIDILLIIVGSILGTFSGIILYDWFENRRQERILIKIYFSRLFRSIFQSDITMQRIQSKSTLLYNVESRGMNKPKKWQDIPDDEKEGLT